MEDITGYSFDVIAENEEKSKCSGKNSRIVFTYSLPGVLKQPTLPKIS